MRAKPPEWKGRTVVCIASGPSLTPEDCETVRLSGHPVVVTNTTFRLCPWADVLYGFDANWWRVHIEEVRASFKGRLICNSQLSARMGVETTNAESWFRGMGNSGVAAIAFAVGGGASKVVLLGYDCGLGPNKEKHWHGDHPKGMSNCASMAKWFYQFKQISRYCNQQGARVLNASRRTALECFETMALEDALRDR